MSFSPSSWTFNLSLTNRQTVGKNNYFLGIPLTILVCARLCFSCSKRSLSTYETTLLIVDSVSSNYRKVVRAPPSAGQIRSWRSRTAASPCEASTNSPNSTHGPSPLASPSSLWPTPSSRGCCVISCSKIRGKIRGTARCLFKVRIFNWYQPITLKFEWRTQQTHTLHIREWIDNLVSGCFFSSKIINIRFITTVLRLSVPSFAWATLSIGYRRLFHLLILAKLLQVAHESHEPHLHGSPLRPQQMYVSSSRLQHIYPHRTNNCNQCTQTLYLRGTSISLPTILEHRVESDICFASSW